jgi:hypothetical protein
MKLSLILLSSVGLNPNINSLYTSAAKVVKRLANIPLSVINTLWLDIYKPYCLTTIEKQTLKQIRCVVTNIASLYTYISIN